MRQRRFIPTLVFLSLLLQSQLGFAVETRGRLVIPPAQEKINGLKWKSTEFPIKIELDGAYFKSFAIIDGTYLRGDWDLLLDTRQVARNKNGDFRFKIQITRKVTEFNLFAIGPYGGVEKQRLSIVISDWETNEDELRPKAKPGWYLTPGVSVSYISYRETNVPDWKATALTGKLFFNTPIPPHWEFGASTYLTLAPLSKSPNVNARFFGLNARFGYVLPFVAEPWRLSIQAGAYYTTTFVAGNQFGYKDIAGPQLFPMLRRNFKKGDSITSYLKYSPVSDKFQLLSFTNRELAAGVSFSHPFENGHPLSVALDFSNLQVTIGSTKINTTTGSLGIGYGL